MRLRALAAAPSVGACAGAGSGAGAGVGAGAATPTPTPTQSAAAVATSRQSVGVAVWRSSSELETIVEVDSGVPSRSTSVSTVHGSAQKASVGPFARLSDSSSMHVAEAEEGEVGELLPIG